MAIKERFTKFAQTLRNWGIFGDVRSAIVGSCFGAVVGLLAAALAEQPGKEIIIETNEDGYAQPMNTLLSEMNKAKSEISVTFEPPSLQSVYVCEYVRIKGYIYRDVFLTYLNKYSMCFMPIEAAENQFIIRPNPNSNIVVEEAGNWLCKCNPSG